VNMKRYQIILIVIFLVAAIGIVSQSDANEEQRSAEQYCHMVKLWKETRGHSGWPAYNGDWMCE
jgi:hypothetical protein